MPEEAIDPPDDRPRAQPPKASAKASAKPAVGTFTPPKTGAKNAPPPPRLTALGERTLNGYVQRWGPLEGREKFDEALGNGVLERDRILAAKPKKKAKAAPVKAAAW